MLVSYGSCSSIILFIVFAASSLSFCASGTCGAGGGSGKSGKGCALAFCSSDINP